jgi:hypothetical protein
MQTDCKNVVYQPLSPYYKIAFLPTMGKLVQVRQKVKKSKISNSFFGSTSVWIQGLTLARQVLYHFKISNFDLGIASGRGRAG